MISALMIKSEYLILNDKSNLYNILNHRFNKTGNAKLYFNSLIEKLNLNIREEYKFNILDFLYKEYPIPLQSYLISFEINKSAYWILSWLESRNNRIPPDYAMELLSNIYEVSTKEMKSFIALKIADLYTHNQDLVKGQLLIKYYLEVGNYKLLEAYFKDREFTNERFESFLENLDRSLVTTKLTLAQKLDLTFYSKQWLLLLNLFHQLDDIEYVLKLDSKIPEEFHSQLLDIYINLSKKYLESHVGQKSHQKIESIARHIRLVYKSKFHTLYVNELKHLFPNRKLIHQI